MTVESRTRKFRLVHPDSTAYHSSATTEAQQRGRRYLTPTRRVVALYFVQHTGAAFGHSGHLASLHRVAFAMPHNYCVLLENAVMLSALEVAIVKVGL